MKLFGSYISHYTNRNWVIINAYGGFVMWFCMTFVFLIAIHWKDTHAQDGHSYKQMVVSLWNDKYNITHSSESLMLVKWGLNVFMLAWKRWGWSQHGHSLEEENSLHLLGDFSTMHMCLYRIRASPNFFSSLNSSSTAFYHSHCSISTPEIQ